MLKKIAVTLTALLAASLLFASAAQAARFHPMSTGDSFDSARFHPTPPKSDVINAARFHPVPPPVPGA